MRRYKQSQSGTWHLVYANAMNCNRYNPANWKNDSSPVEEKDLPPGAKICKKCFINNQ